MSINHNIPYNKHDLFEKLKNTPVKIEESLRDVLMNPIRGKKLVKVVLNFTETDCWKLTIYDIDNTGSTPNIVTGQLLYVVGDENRDKNESGKLGVHGVGLDQFIAKITSEDSITNNGGINVLTHRVGENDDKHFQMTGANPWLYGNDSAIAGIEMKNLDSVDESEIDFVDGLIPTENYLAIEIPGVNFDTFDFASDSKTSLEVMADMVATYFVKALDDKVLSFHFRKTDKEGNTESIDVTEGAKFIDEFGNFVSYDELPKHEFVTAKEHKYVGRFNQSTKLTPVIKQEAEQKGYRIFGHIPELGIKHEDNWSGHVIDATDGSGVVLGRFEEGRAAGVPFSVMFVEIPVDNVGTDTNKSSVLLPSSRKYRKHEWDGTPIKGLDGKLYKPILQTGQINTHFKEFAKECNPKQQFKETSRRDLGRRILMGELPYQDERCTIPAINPAVVEKFLEVHNMDWDSDITKISFPKEVELYGGRVVLDQGVRNGTSQMAIEWKKKEKDVKFNQCVAEIEGWRLRYGEYPTHFMLAADSAAKDFPRDFKSNFGEDIKSIVEDLKDSYPNIEFRLLDTRYFELNKKYEYFKSYK